MSRKTLIYIGMAVGSTIGGLIPGLWDAGILSLSSILLTAVGGVIGIWAGYRISRFI